MPALIQVTESSAPSKSLLILLILSTSRFRRWDSLSTSFCLQSLRDVKQGLRQSFSYSRDPCVNCDAKCLAFLTEKLTRLHRGARSISRGRQSCCKVNRSIFCSTWLAAIANSDPFGCLGTPPLSVQLELSTLASVEAPYSKFEVSACPRTAIFRLYSRETAPATACRSGATVEACNLHHPSSLRIRCHKGGSAVLQGLGTSHGAELFSTKQATPIPFAFVRSITWELQGLGVKFPYTLKCSLRTLLCLFFPHKSG